MFLIVLVSAAAGPALSARLTRASGTAEAAARPPAARPERFRKLRRLTVDPATPERILARPVLGAVACVVFLVSIARLPKSPGAARALEPREGVYFLHMLGFAVAGRFRGRRRGDAGRPGDDRERAGGAGAEHADTEEAPARGVARGGRLVVVRLSSHEAVLPVSFGGSRRHRDTLRLDVDEGGADRADRPIEHGRGASREIGEETRRPAGDMVGEEALLRGQRHGAEIAGDEPGHHLAQGGNMVLGLAHPVGQADAQPRHVAAQPRQRLLMQEAGPVVGSVGNELAMREADGEGRIFLDHAGRVARPGGGGKRGEGASERAVVTLDRGNRLERRRIGSGAQQPSQQAPRLAAQLLFRRYDEFRLATVAQLRSLPTSPGAPAPFLLLNEGPEFRTDFR